MLRKGGLRGFDPQAFRPVCIAVFVEGKGVASRCESGKSHRRISGLFFCVYGEHAVIGAIVEHGNAGFLQFSALPIITVSDRIQDKERSRYEKEGNEDPENGAAISGGHDIVDFIR